MTDLERFKELYASFGITLEEQRFAADAGRIILTLEVEEGQHPKLKGYMGFGSDVAFCVKTGKFLDQSFWE
jgi:hypothetical protein